MEVTKSNITITDVNSQVVKSFNKTKTKRRLIVCSVLLAIWLVTLLRLPFTGCYLDAIFFDYLFGVGKYFVYAFLLALIITKFFNQKIKIFFSKKLWLFDLLVLVFILIMCSAISWMLGKHGDAKHTFLTPLVDYQSNFKHYLLCDGRHFKGEYSWSANFINKPVTGGIFAELVASIAFVGEYITLFICEIIILVIAFCVVVGSNNLKIFRRIRKWIIKLLGGTIPDVKNIDEELDSKFKDKKPVALDQNAIKIEAIKEQQTTPPLSFLTDTGENYDAKNKDKIIKCRKHFEKFLIDKDIHLVYNSMNVMPLFIQLVYRTSNDDNVYKLLHFKQDVLNIFRTDKINFYLKNGALSIEIFNPAPSKVSIKSVLSSNVVNDSAINKNTVSAVGVSYDSNNIIFDFEKDPSTLIVGKPGSGAIMEISSLIMSRIYHNTPDQLKLLLCSVKEEKVFETFSGLTHLYTAPSMNQEDTAINLTNILNLIEHRTKLFSEKRCNNINEYNNLPNEEKVPNILIAIFDLESFFRASANNPNILLRILSNEAIKVGIQVILYSENIDELLWSKFLEQNVKSFFIFKVDSEYISKAILNSSRATELFGSGDGFMLLRSNHSKTRIQSCYINKKEIADTIKIINTFYECKQK